MSLPQDDGAFASVIVIPMDLEKDIGMPPQLPIELMGHLSDVVWSQFVNNVMQQLQDTNEQMRAALNKVLRNRKIRDAMRFMGAVIGIGLFLYFEGVLPGQEDSKKNGSGRKKNEIDVFDIEVTGSLLGVTVLFYVGSRFLMRTAEDELMRLRDAAIEKMKQICYSNSSPMVTYEFFGGEEYPQWCVDVTVNPAASMPPVGGVAMPGGGFGAGFGSPLLAGPVQMTNMGAPGMGGGGSTFCPRCGASKPGAFCGSCGAS